MARVSYRESFGLSLPVAGTDVDVKFMPSLEYYIIWVDCPDNENVLLKGPIENLREEPFGQLQVGEKIKTVGTPGRNGQKLPVQLQLFT